MYVNVSVCVSIVYMRVCVCARHTLITSRAVVLCDVCVLASMCVSSSQSCARLRNPNGLTGRPYVFGFLLAGCLAK